MTHAWRELSLAERQAMFLDAYETLVRKTGIYISACSCCDSPWPTNFGIEEPDRIERHLKHLRRASEIREGNEP